MKAISALILLLLLVACATGGADLEGGQEGFVAPEVADDAVQEPAKPPAPLTGLSSDEEGRAALLVSRLERAGDQAARDAILNRLIELGPRYLPFFRTIDHEPVMLDILYVMGRIERANEIEPVQATNTPRVEQPAESPVDRSLANTSGAYDRDEVEKFMAAQLKLAQTWLDRGRAKDARDIAEAAIMLLPDTRWRAEFDAVILRAQGDADGELLVAGTLALEPGNLQYAAMEHGAAFLEPLNIRCFLKNVSSGPVTLMISEGRGSPGVLLLSVRYIQTDYQVSQGAPLTQTGNVTLPVDAAARVTLQPNETWEMAVPLTSLTSLDPDAPLKNAMGIAEIDATLRVSGALNAEGRPIFLRPVRFPMQSVPIFPARFDIKQATDKPLSTLRALIEAEMPQDIFLCAHLINGRSVRPAADILLAEDLAASPLNVQRARLSAMRVLFKTGSTWDAREWRTWWAENRHRH